MKYSLRLALILSICSIIIFMAGCEEKTAATKSTTETIRAKQEVQKQADEETEKVDTPQEGTPKIVLENNTYDFGSIDPGSKNKGEFTFINEGDGVLKISKIKSTCGCTIPQLKKKTYLPGESGTIKLVYSASQKSGSVKKALYILNNDSKNPKLAFYIKAKVVQKISYEPKQLKMRFDKDNAGAENIKIESLDKRQFAISRITVRPDCMDFDFDPAAENTSFTLTPKVKMDKLNNVNRGAITLYLTHPSQKKVSIGFNVLPPYKPDPATLIALNVSPDKPVRKVLYILSNYGEDFDVESVEATNDIIQIVSREKMQDKYVITLDIVAPEDSGRKRHFNSKLKVKIAGGETLTISCVGSIKKNP